MQIPHEDQSLEEQFNSLSLVDNEDLEDKLNGEIAIIRLKLHNDKADHLQQIPQKEEVDKHQVANNNKHLKQAPDNQPEVEKQVEENNYNHKIIEGTIRPDGSKRKDIKIRAGYMNPELATKYVIPQKRIISQKQ